jgi:hypothetical protein
VVLVDALIVFTVIVALLVIVDLAAAQFGVDSRDGFSEPSMHQSWR